MSTLLITVDCLRADHVGAYGYSRPTTPNLDSISDHGLLFDGIANSPGTRWALQTIHSGAYQSQFDGVGLPKNFNSLARTFQEHGYKTAGFSCNGFLSRDYNYDIGFETFLDSLYFESGTENQVKSGAQSYLPETFVHQVLRPLYRSVVKFRHDGKYRSPTVDADVVDEAVEWIRSQSSEWFAWVHLMDAHTPYSRWDNHLRTLRGDTDIEHIVSPEIQKGGSPSQAVIDAYDAGIRSTDQQIGRLYREVDAETTLLITGDHGEEFGKYGDFHSASLWSSMSQVPFIIRPKSSSCGLSRSSEFAQHLDIAPTIADMEELPFAEHWKGNSIFSRGKNRETIIQHVQDQMGARKGDWKYLQVVDGKSIGLFQTKFGDDDRQSLLKTNPDILDELKEAISEYREICKQDQIGSGASKDPQNADISESVKENLRELGYTD